METGAGNTVKDIVIRSKRECVPNLQGTSRFGRDDEGRSYRARAIDRSRPSRRSRGSENSSPRRGAICREAVTGSWGVVRSALNEWGRFELVATALQQVALGVQEGVLGDNRRRGSSVGGF